MIRLFFTLLAVVLTPIAAHAQTGQWVVATDRWGNKEYSTLNLVAKGRALTGDWDGDPLTGTG